MATWEDVTHSTGTSATTFDASFGATVNSGDLIISCIMQEYLGTPNFTEPTGHTNILRLAHSNAKTIEVAEYDADGTEDSTTDQWTSDQSSVWAGSVIRISDHGGVDVSGTTAAGFQEDIDSPSVTTTVNNCLVIIGVMCGNTTDPTDPASTTRRFHQDAQTNLNLTVNSFVQTTAGATGAKTWDFSDSFWKQAFTVAIQPSAGGGIVVPVVTRTSMNIMMNG